MSDTEQIDNKKKVKHTRLLIGILVVLLIVLFISLYAVFSSRYDNQGQAGDKYNLGEARTITLDGGEGVRIACRGKGLDTQKIGTKSVQVICQGERNINNGRDKSSTVKPTTPSPTIPSEIAPVITGNPFGVMLGGKNVTAATTLGATYYRPNAVFMSSWNGICTECDQAVNQGLRLILTVRNNGGRQQPTTPPTDYAAYKKTLGAILDKYPPEVLVVENEENSAALFYSGTPQQYHQELKAACEVAHSMSIKCTNGGLVSSLIVLMVANSYNEAGQATKAIEFVTRALGDKLFEQFGISDPTKVLTSSRAKEQIAKGKELLAGYKSSGADYVNFHWYIADTQALEEAVDYLKRVTGLPAMTNEVGQQRTTDPSQVTAIMQKIVDLGLPYAVWFSVDVPGFGEAKSLIDENGNLRPNGQAYKDFIEKTF